MQNLFYLVSLLINYKANLYMKFLFSLITLVIIFSCDNPVEISNERIKSSISKKGTEIRNNYTQYKNDIKTSGFATLLDLERLKQDKNHEESKKIILKAESFLKNFNQKNQTLVFDLKKLFDSIQPTDKITQREIESMENKFKESIKITKSNYKTDSIVLGLHNEIIGILDKCRYEIKEKNLEFETFDCLHEYNSKANRLFKIQMDANMKYLKNKYIKN